MYSDPTEPVVNGGKSRHGRGAGAWFACVLAGAILLAAQAVGAATGNVFVDSFGIGTQRPLCIDRDGNGLADEWEAQHFGGTGKNPQADDDGDGASAIDEFIAGTDPVDPVSVLRIVSADLASPSSDDISVMVAGGDVGATSQFASVGDRSHRRFHVYAADDALEVKRLAAELADTGVGQQVWTDSNAVQQTAQRFYHVDATYGVRSYSNAEEWAVYVQPRAASQKYLVSVPVNLGTGNGLNSTLGQQLARGLHAGAEQADSDELMYRSANAWKYYYLTTNAAGDRLWWDVTANAEADLAVEAGMGFWVVRKGSNDRTRDNCVFAGMSFTNAPSIALSTNDAGDGWTWTVFGWPFAAAKRHQDSGVGATPANQLGFAAGGYGGRSGDSSTLHARQGDQIWVWENNTFGKGYWLMGGIDEEHDGRWARYNFGRTLGDFSLEPGKAYLYRHHVALDGSTTGTNFTWRPAL